MIHLEWPWLLLLAPLPLLYRRWRTPAPLHCAALRPPGYGTRLPAGSPAGGSASRARLALLAVLWLGLLGAAARPAWLGPPAPAPASGRDLLLAVDISGSMEIRDMERNGALIDRLSATKEVVADFIKRRPRDRVGLLLFGGEAYLQVPLTFDHQTLLQLLDSAHIGFAGDGTAIGDAVGLAVKHLRDRPAENRVLILLTDGVNNSGRISPQQAAALAAAHGIRIHTLGVGAEMLLQQGLFGTRRVNPSADLDEAALRHLAESTGGHYSRARDAQQLAEIYRQLDRLEPVAQAPETIRPQRSLAHWPLAAALTASLSLALLRAREGSRV